MAYQVRAKIFNITNHQVKVNQNHNEISLLHTFVRMTVIKSKVITTSGKDMEKRKLSCTVVENIRWHIYHGTTWNNSLVQNWERSMSRLCIFTLLI